MRVLLHMSAIALRTVAGPGSETALLALGDRYGDRSAKLLNALKLANAQAWKAIEVALAGSSWWDKAKRSLASGEQHAFRSHMQAFLDAAPLDDLPGFGPHLRKRCLEELKAARKAGLLPGEQLPDPAEVGASATAMARFQDPRSVLDAEFECVRKTAEELRARSYAALAQVVALRPPDGQPLLVVAVQYFFRKAVQADGALSAEWQFHEMDKLSERQAAGFDGLHRAIAEQGTRLESLLDSAVELLEETRSLLEQLRDDRVADRAQLSDVYALMAKLLERQPTLATADPSETVIVEMREMVEQCNTLPAAEKRQHKVLFRAVGQLKKAVKTFDGKRRLKRGVLPSVLFGTPQPAAPRPAPAAETPAASSAPDDEAVVDTIFGRMVKPKFRKKPS